MSGNQRATVFVSYASEDLQVARQLRDLLVDAGCPTFLSEDDLKLQLGSAQWSEAIDEMLDHAPVLVLIVSPHALESKWVKYEWRSFHEALLGDKTGLIIPVCVAGPSPHKLPRALRGYHCLDARRLDQRGARFRDAVLLARRVLAECAERPVTARPDTLAPRTFSRRGTRLRTWGGAMLLLGGCIAAGMATQLPFAKPAKTTAANLPPTAAPALRSPELGLRALDAYVHPDPKTVAEFDSADAWEGVARDFAQAASQPAAPVRWRAATHLASAQRAMRQGAREQAREELEHSKQIDATWALPHLVLSELECTEAPAKAVEEAKIAIELDPELSFAIMKLATAYVYAGQLELGIEQYRRALVRAPESTAIKASLSLALHSAGGSYDLEAERLARDVLERDPDSLQAHLVLAERALDEGNAQVALQHAEAASVLAPQLPAAQLAKADALQLSGRIAQAFDAWRVAVDLKNKLGEWGAPHHRLQLVAAALEQGRIPPRRTTSAVLTTRSLPVPKTRALVVPRPERSRPRLDVNEF